MTTQIVMCWSGGKDSAYALHRLVAGGGFDVRGILTTVTETYGRISMHGVRTDLLEAQAAALGLPLHTVPIPAGCTNAEYETRMGAACQELKAGGVSALGFGDLFLEDIRAYRERQCAEAGLEPVFPIWGEPTPALARKMLDEGFRATLCTVDPKQLDPAWAGHAFDAELLEGLPEKVDPCGENGEFHTFVHDGPGFREPIPVLPGERVMRGGFAFADLIPAVQAREGA